MKIISSTPVAVQGKKYETIVYGDDDDLVIEQASAAGGELTDCTRVSGEHVRAIIAHFQTKQGA